MLVFVIRTGAPLVNVRASVSVDADNVYNCFRAVKPEIPLATSATPSAVAG